MTAVASGLIGPIRSRRSFWQVFNWPGILVIVVLLVIWELVVDTGVFTFDSLPAPTAIFSAGVQLFASGSILMDTGHTLTAMFVGWLIGGAIGIVIGLWLGLSKWARRFVLATLDVFRAAPGIVFLPLAILLFGFSIQSEIVIVAYVCVWPVLVNSIAGAQAVTSVHRDTATTLHMKTLPRVGKITLPTAIPYIVNGLKLSLTTGLALAVVAEMIGNPQGLGYQIIFYSGALKPASMFAVIIWIGILGILLNVVFDLLSNLIPAVRASKAGV